RREQPGEEVTLGLGIEPRAFVAAAHPEALAASSEDDVILTQYGRALTTESERARGLSRALVAEKEAHAAGEADGGRVQHDAAEKEQDFVQDDGQMNAEIEMRDPGVPDRDLGPHGIRGEVQDRRHDLGVDLPARVVAAEHHFVERYAGARPGPLVDLRKHELEVDGPEHLGR